MSLPYMPNGDGIRKQITVQFGGLNCNDYAQDGAIANMENMSSDKFPLLSPRLPRFLVRQSDAHTGFYAGGGLYVIDGVQLIRRGEDGAEEVLMEFDEQREREIIGIGPYLIFLPDMAYYHTLDKTHGGLAAEMTVTASFEDGTFSGVAAKGNTIKSVGAGFDAVFKAGQPVQIEGAGGNDKEIIIREISADTLVFFENSFANAPAAEITIRRRVPALDGICENENRLWGYEGNTIYACKPGDPFSWYAFDGLATDSYSVAPLSAGDFTACCSYMGYPVFFKEENIYKVYGDKPSNFSVMAAARLGVSAGSGRSLAIAGEILFYLSRAGIVGYNGGTPYTISEPLGNTRYKNAVGGSDGLKYYVSMQDEDDRWHLFVYDTRRKVWHREDERQIRAFGFDKELYFMDAAGDLWCWGSARARPAGSVGEGDVQSAVEFADFVESSPNRKGISKLQLRYEIAAGAGLAVLIQYDSSGDWETVREMQPDSKRSVYLPIVPHRCDHFRLRLEGFGRWLVHSLVREVYGGSELTDGAETP